MLQIGEVFLKLWRRVIKHTGVEVVIREVRGFVRARESACCAVLTSCPHQPE
jgi:hypothetical protein